jgi:hypothetical protein
MLRNWLLSGAVVAGVALALGVAIQLAERPRSYRDAVSEALDQRQIAYTGLEVREICLPDPGCIIGDGTRAVPPALVKSPATTGAAIATWIFHRWASSTRRCVICAACAGCRGK